MRRPASNPVLLLTASLAIAVVSVACGLGDIPTRPPRSATPETPGPTPSPTPIPLPTATPSPTPKPEPTPLVYKVKAGDSLLSIAKKFKTSARSIAFWNRAKYKSLDPDSTTYDPNRIEIGWRLTITPGVKIEDGGAPTDASPTPEPSISLGPAILPPADGSGLLVTHGSRASNAIALTFDLGGSPETALPIVQWLIDQRVEATFFTTGELAQSDMTAHSVLALVAAHPDLFTVGDGGWTSGDLTAMTAPAIADQLVKADGVISAAVGSTTKPIFRPADGSQNATVRSAAAHAGFPYAVLWDVDADDAVPETGGGATADDMVTKIAARAAGGSIIRLHLGGPYTLDALPGILSALGGAGLHPVTISRLLGL